MGRRQGGRYRRCWAETEVSEISEGSVIRDLRQASDEALTLRLRLLSREAPADYEAEDYVYRRDVWEMANSAIRAEIRRRRSKVPAPADVVDRPPSVLRSRTMFAIGYLATIPAAALLVKLPALTPFVLLATVVCGGAWLLPELRRTGFTSNGWRR